MTGRRGALQYLYIVASAAVPKYNLFLIIELIAWMSPKQALPTNYIISIYIVIYDVPWCANTWLNFRLRETTLFKARLRRIEGHDLGALYTEPQVLLDSWWSPSTVQKESTWSPSGVDQDSIRSGPGVDQESIWSPSGVHQESTWSPSGVHQEFTRSPFGVHSEYTWSPSGAPSELISDECNRWVLLQCGGKTVTSMIWIEH